MSTLPGRSPSWSPDGTELVFESDGAIYRVPADGSREPEMVLDAAARVRDLHWAPDGGQVVFTGMTESDGAELSVLTLATGDVDRPFPSPANESNPRISPDGQWVVYQSDESGETDVYLRRFPDGERRWRVSNAGGLYPKWGPSGDEIF